MLFMANPDSDRKGMAELLRICPNCSKKNHGSSRFCERCGYSFELKAMPSSEVTTRKAKSRWPDLYDTPRQTAGPTLGGLLRIAYSPRKAFPSLYLSASLHSGILILIVSGALIWFFGSVALGEDALDTANRFLGGLLSFVAYFVVIVVLASIFSVFPFKGRGDFRATFTLLSYCQPWAALWSLLMTAGFVFWHSALENGSPVAIIVMFVVLAIGALLILGMYAEAISVANDLSESSGAFATLASLFVASQVNGLMAVAVKSIGIESSAWFVPLDFLNLL